MLRSSVFDAAQGMTAVMTAKPAAPARSSAGWFYMWFGVFCAVLTFGAFAPTFLIPAAIGRFSAPAILSIHGVLFLAWPVFFALQAFWAASGRIERHRLLGLAGVALATAMACVGIAALASALHDWSEKGYEAQGRAVTVIAFSGLLLFTIFVAAALANVRRPEIHKRLMLLATISIMQASVGRILFTIVAARAAPFSRPGMFEPPDPSIATASHFVAAALLIASAAAYDWRVRGRPHPVTLLGGAGILIVIALRTQVIDTPLWRAITDALFALGA